MQETIISGITFLYASTGIIAVIGFLPTLEDLFLKKKNSANPLTALTWAITNGIATMYGFFVVDDFLFTFISGASCCCFLVIFARSLYLSKHWISHVSPPL